MHTVFSRSQESAQGLAREFALPKATTDMKQAVEDPDTDVVIIGLPNDLHVEAVSLAASAGKAVLCTKPLGHSSRGETDVAGRRVGGRFRRISRGLVYPPKTLKAISSVEDGALGKVLWVRSRETNPGPHSDWV